MTTQIENDAQRAMAAGRMAGLDVPVDPVFHNEPDRPALVTPLPVPAASGTQDMDRLPASGQAQLIEAQYSFIAAQHDWIHTGDHAKFMLAQELFIKAQADVIKNLMALVP